MPTKTLRFYNFELCQLIIGPVVVGGYGEDGGVEYEMSSDVNEMIVGSDGEATVSHLNNDMVIATITLKETSVAYKQLMALATAQWTLQRTPGGGSGALPYSHFDPTTGDAVVERQSIFLNRPSPNKSRTAGDREIRIGLPYAGRNIDFANLLAPAL